MLIRTREEAARGGSPVGHGPSVKVYHSKGNFDMILENIVINDYAKNPVNYRKSQDELDADKKEIVDEVRKRLQDDTISINFGK